MNIIAELTGDHNLGRPKLWSFTSAHILPDPFGPKVLSLHIEEVSIQGWFCMVKALTV